jgi:hypothetical protein
VGGLRSNWGLSLDLFDRGAPCRLPLLLLAVPRTVMIVDHPCAAASFRATRHGSQPLGEADMTGGVGAAQLGLNKRGGPRVPSRFNMRLAGCLSPSIWLDGRVSDSSTIKIH